MRPHAAMWAPVHHGGAEPIVVQISNWITGFYDARRRHSACGGMSPIGYEAI
jgi:hypothetical protein